MLERDQRDFTENQNNSERQGSGMTVDNQQEISNDSENSRSISRMGSSNRGFAAMSSERQKQIASEGGRAAHKQGVAHEWNSDEARRAGRKGGQSVSQNREHMSEIGRRGGQSSGGRRKNQQNDEGIRE